MIKSLNKYIVVTIVFACTISVLNAMAAPISFNKAKEIAGRFLSTAENNLESAESSSFFNSRRNTKLTIKEAPLPFYIFNDTEGGFVIVSNSSNTLPILAYSFDNQFSLDNVSPGLSFWLEGIADSIIEYEYNNSCLDSLSNQRNKLSLSSSGSPSSFKLETALWGQGYPFNSKCPTIDGVSCYTGCLATAIAIIMRYWKWPSSGNGHIPAYYYDTQGNTFGTFDPSSIYPDRTIYCWGDYDLGCEYNWELMPLTSSNSYSTEEVDAISILMRDCGAILQSAYGLNYTGARFDIAYRLGEYMDYDKSMQMLEELHQSSFEEWGGIIKNEIAEGRPVLMSGFSSTTNGGHAYVIDGYDENDFFSINWGWEGSNNGFYCMNPYDSYNKTYPDYFITQNAYIGLSPNKGGNPKYHLSWSVGDQYLKIEDGQFEVSTPFNLINTNYCSLIAYDNADYYGDYAVAVLNASGKLKSLVTEPVPMTSTNHSIPTRIDNCVVYEQPEPGDYLTIVFRSHGNTEWEPVRYYRDQVNSIIYLNESEKLDDKTSIIIDPNIKEVLFGYRKETSKLMDIKTMFGTEFFIYDENGNRVEYFDAEGELHFFYAKILDYEPSVDYQRYYVFLSNLPSGKYKIVLRHSLQYKEFEFTI